MGSLLAALSNSAQALGVYSQALQVVSNDVTNANTPGYVKQSLNLEALPFDVSIGLPGGVKAGSMHSYRDAYAEQNVRDQQSATGYYQQQTSALTPLSNLFDLSAKTGISAGLTNLFQSFSQLSISPNDTTARQNVLDAGGALAHSFQGAAVSLQTASREVNTNIRNTVTQINRLAGTIAGLNARYSNDSRAAADPSLDAKLNSSLEELSQYVNFTALQQPDGSVSVYVGGQTPVVLGNQSMSLSADFSSSQTGIRNSDGKDITSQLSQGQLSGLLDVQNTKIPAYTDSLNRLAQGVADQVNAGLTNGVDASGSAPVYDLFTYDLNSGAAQSLAVNPNITPDQIAAASPGAAGGNGNVLALSALGGQNVLDGGTFTQFFGRLGSRVGADIASASSDGDTQTQLLTQAQTLRQQTSGVSLDEEAAKLIQYQQSYQAASKLVTVLDELTATTINMIT